MAELRSHYDKKELRNYIKEQVFGKIKTLDFYRNFTLEASKDIKKTPKYDSFREEMQEEIYHLDKQMYALKKMQGDLAKVLPARSSEAKIGALVVTNKARFYISVGLGEFFFENDRFYAVSPESPIAKIMEGKKVGDEFVLNKIHQKIEKIL